MSYICNLCPRKCGALRTENANNGGVCKIPYGIYVSRAAKHMWEETCISGTMGSGTIFFSGCQLRCCYCQNYKISRENFGKEISINRLAEIFKELETSGVHNINLVSPTPYIPFIIEALKIYKPSIPIVYNSGGYETEETINLLKSFVDIFLLDFKYFSEDRAVKYSRASDYPEIAKMAIKAVSDVKNEYSADGMMQKGVIVRHLLLPGGTTDAINIIKWIKEYVPQVVFSLMSQYTIIPNQPYKELNRKITEREYDKVAEFMMDMELDGYIQELDSGSDKYIPDFDLCGV